MERGCGRLGKHEPHNWWGRLSRDAWFSGPSLNPKVEFYCSGMTVREGGHRGVF